MPTEIITADSTHHGEPFEHSKLQSSLECEAKSTGKINKPRKWKSGTVAKREISKLSKTTDNLFPRASFQRLVREVTQSVSMETRYTEEAMMAIHVAAEQFVTDTFVKADLARRHARRKTLHVNDIQFSKYMTQTTSDIVGNTVEDV
jgi:histone H3